MQRAQFSAFAANKRGITQPQQTHWRATVLGVAILPGIAGEERVIIVGHDWGGTLAYSFAQQHPELTAKLVVLNAAHPDSYARALTSSLQILRSWYLQFYQLRGIAEWVVTRRWV